MVSQCIHGTVLLLLTLLLLLLVTMTYNDGMKKRVCPDKRET